MRIGTKGASTLSDKEAKRNWSGTSASSFLLFLEEFDGLGPCWLTVLSLEINFFT